MRLSPLILNYQTLNIIVAGIDKYIGVTIVSTPSEEIRQMAVNVMGRCVTVKSCKRGYGKCGETKEVEIIYAVITRLELNKLNSEIQKTEPTVFIEMNREKDLKGGMIKKRPMKH